MLQEQKESAKSHIRKNYAEQLHRHRLIASGYSHEPIYANKR